MLRTDPRHIPTYLLLSPQLQVWPPQRNRTVLWTLANLVFYQMQTLRTLSMLDYMDLTNRASWNSYQEPSRSTRVGNYLEVL